MSFHEARDAGLADQLIKAPEGSVANACLQALAESPADFWGPFEPAPGAYIYSAVKHACEVVMPSILPRGYIVFDDATVRSCIDATEAFENFVIRRDGVSSEQIHPQFVFRAP